MTTATEFEKTGSGRRKRRIAFVINSLDGGGAERVLSILLGRYAAAPDLLDGAELHLVLLDTTEERYPVPESVVTHRLGSSGGLVGSIRLLAAALRRIRPDASVSFLARSNCANVLASRRLGIPCVVCERINTTSHHRAGLSGRINRAIIRLLYPRADLVLANSAGIRDDLAANYAVPRQRIGVIFNPFDLDAIGRLGAEAPSPALARPYMLGVGRLTRNKNFALLIRAFAAAGVPGGLVLLGQGEDRDMLARLGAEAGLGGRLHLPGFVSNPYPLVRAASAFVSPSNAEGFPNAVAEAMALGVPVISTDCPSGPSELLEGTAPPGAGVVQAKHGILVPVEDAAAMTEAIRAVQAPGLAKHYSEAGRRRMEAFRADAIAAEFAAAIRGVLRA